MKRGISLRILRWAAVLCVLTFVPLVRGAELEEGYILGSQVNVRNAPNSLARIVAVLPIGTPIQFKRVSDDWCEISFSTSIAARRYVLCSLLTPQRPTLEIIDVELARADLDTTQEGDFLGRRFYLSPSLNTIAQARLRRKMPAEDRWRNPTFGGRESLAQNEIAGHTTVEDRVLIAGLLESFRGELTGYDFRPVDLHINEHVVTDLPAFLRAVHDNVHGTDASVRSVPTVGLPVVARSLFSNEYDVMVVGRISANRSDQSASSLQVETIADVIEFSKLYPRQRLLARHTELVSRHHEAESLYGWNRTGGVDVMFAHPPRALAIVGNRTIDAKLVRAHVRLAARECGDEPRSQTITVEFSRPIFSNGLVLVLGPNLNVTEVDRIGTSINPALYDLNGDGVADLAEAVVTSSDDADDDIWTSAVFLNINGSWRLAFQQFNFRCD